MAALASAVPAGASPQPVRRTFGETALPRVRSGTLVVPAAHRTHRIRVVVRLRLAPLAASYRRTFAAAETQQRLNVSSPTSRRYLARVAASQQRAAAELRRSIPSARIGERYQIVFDGFAVDLPVSKLPVLTRMSFAAHVYPTLQYTLSTNHSPGVIGADELHAATGARGDGVKIGVVDDGVDPRNPFFDASSFSYPSGFPLGDDRFTSPKVIVARSFPGPGAGAAGKLPVDPTVSFHATHVAGIAAGDAGTCSPGGRDHPPTCGLSGVAPRAWLGNYRVFTVPTPAGVQAFTPELIAAFEAAVRDGMDVVNFSGGGPETDPVNDALIDTIRNVAAAGVVPVIAAGNDRDSFGLGTVGSPGTAPDAITVAAVSNTHVFTPTMSVVADDAPANVRGIPIASAGGEFFPPAFARQTRLLVDIGTFTTRGGEALDRRLCGPDDDPNNETKTPLLPGSLRGAIALVTRGHCTFASKALRAADAGAVGIVIVDNRAGEAEPIPIALPIPAGKIADLDGATLRAYLAQHDGAAPVVVGSQIEQVETGRSGIVTDFSSAGLTDFTDLLKPDVSAPGGAILSSTLPEFTGGSPFAVFDGTSMATPHVAGAAALLVQLHRGWTPQQIKSALVATAGPAWGNTARTQEAPVPLEGGGLVNVARAADPKVFTTPATLSFQRLDVTHRADDRALLVRVRDAGGGTGTWSVGLAPQSATQGASIDVPPAVDVPPGGEGELAVIAHAASGAPQGQDYGFIVLRNGDVTRRIPYAFDVSHPALAALDAQPLKKVQTGDTRGESRVTAYCCPSAPFGPPSDYVGPAMDETGEETLYVTTVQKPLVNLGVSTASTASDALIHPWVLGSKDERDVQGYAATPVNMNELMFDSGIDVGAAGVVFPRQQQFFVSVDSGIDPFTHASHPGPYRLRFWQNDLTPPRVNVLTTRVSAGRPTIVARVLDSQSGVDPLSLVISYRRVLVGAALYDAATGLAVFPLPAAAARVPAGKTKLVLEASDLQETKNIATLGNKILPNTRFKTVTLRGVTGPALTWLVPRTGQCLRGATAPLAVVASSSRTVASVRFSADGRRIGVDRDGAAGLFAVTWHIGGVNGGAHRVTALATDAAGKRLSATRVVRICK
jgi:minor extracellular serine protease Vpr